MSADARRPTPRRRTRLLDQIADEWAFQARWEIENYGAAEAGEFWRLGHGNLQIVDFIIYSRIQTIARKPAPSQPPMGNGLRMVAVITG